MFLQVFVGPQGGVCLWIIEVSASGSPLGPGSVDTHSPGHTPWDTHPQTHRPPSHTSLMYHTPCWPTTPPPGHPPPTQTHPLDPYGQQATSTHPTRMHSSCTCLHFPKSHLKGHGQFKATFTQCKYEGQSEKNP